MWILRQAEERALDAARVRRVAELATLLLYLNERPAEERADAMRRLDETWHLPGLAELARALGAAAAIPRAQMGAHRDQDGGVSPENAPLEIWLRLETLEPSSSSSDDSGRSRREAWDAYYESFL